MKFTKSQLIFLAILLTAVFFRLYQLSLVPPSPSLDEVSIGYNAYSILHTGKDEYGYRFPILLRAYDDYRPALYVYLVVPFIKILGLSVLAVRLPSVLLSVITVIATYFLTKEIFRKYVYRNTVSLLAMFFLAISPWHIYISRLGHEVNAGSTLGVLGGLFFLQSVRSKRKWLLIISSVFFGFSLYTYQGEKVFIPLLIFVLTACYWKALLQIKKTVFIAIMCGLIITFPIILSSFSSQGITRFNATSAFENLNDVYIQNAKQLLYDKQHGNLAGQIVNNRRLIPVKIFLSNYFSHFNPYWLIENSGDERFKIPGLGVIFIWELPSILFGLLFLLRAEIEKEKKIILICWIILSFVAPAITTQTPHAMRSFTILPCPQILDAIGITGIFIFLFSSRNFVIKNIAVSIFSSLVFLIIIGSTLFLYRQYFFIFPARASKPYQYAALEAMKYINQHKNEYKKIIVSNQNDLTQSYMFYLFTSKYDPKIYLAHGGTGSGGFAVWHKIDNIEFRPIDWMKEKKESRTLYVGSISDFPLGFPAGIDVNYLDGTKAIKIITE